MLIEHHIVSKNEYDVIIMGGMVKINITRQTGFKQQ